MCFSTWPHTPNNSWGCINTFCSFVFQYGARVGYFCSVILWHSEFIEPKVLRRIDNPMVQLSLSLSLSYFLILSCNVYPFPQICLLHSWPVMHDLLFDFSLLLKLSLQAKSRIPFRPTNICMLGRG